MTIKELIEALKMFPEEMEVKVADFDRKGNLVFIDIKPEQHVVEYEDNFVGIGGYQMKLRKTRIKKTTKANGSVQYVAEYKWGFWWYQFNDMMAPIGDPRAICCDWIRSKDVITRSEQEAKELIDFYIARVNYINACLVENEVVKVEHERYP